MSLFSQSRIADNNELKLHGVELRGAKKITNKAGLNYIESSQETLAVEKPIAMVYNGISHAVMLATPCDLEDFALGFSLTEGIIKHARELLDITIETSTHGIVLHMMIVQERLHGLKEKRRFLTGKTGCGLCGVESLEQMSSLAIQLLDNNELKSYSLVELSAIIAKSLQQLAPLQLLMQQSGATHCAAWTGFDGHIELVREDVGRHNALDKLLGAIVGRGTDMQTGFVLMSSRASYEIVHKSAILGVPLVVAISAPTQLAVDLAQKTGQILAGFARDDRVTFYTNYDY